MIGNSQIQQAWIAKLKANSAVTAVVNALEIRENSWKGTGFTYPCIRVKLTRLSPTTPGSDCKIFRSEVSILCFSEIKSSKEADDIAKVVTEQFWTHPFTYAGVKFTSINLIEVIPAYVVPEDEDSWVSEVNLSCLVQSA